MFNVFVKQRLAFFNCLFMRFITYISGATVMHKCWFIVFLWCGVVEAEPRIIETAPSQQRNIGSEVINCGLECGELRHEELVHRMRPVGNDRINGAEFCKKDTLELGTNSGATPAISSSIAKPSNEASGENASSYWQKIGNNDVYGFIHGALIGGAITWYMFWIIGIPVIKKHNVKLTGGLTAESEKTNERPD